VDENTLCMHGESLKNTINGKPFAHKRGNGVSQLTVALVSVLDVLPHLLLGQGVSLTGHMTRLCCGLLQHQAAAVVPDAAHHIKSSRSTRHYHLILCTQPLCIDACMQGSAGLPDSSVYAGEGRCNRQFMHPMLHVQ